MVDNSQQFVSLTVDFFEFLQGDGSVHFFPVDHVAVAAMVESFEVNYEVLWQGVEVHGLVGQLVVLAC